MKTTPSFLLVTAASLVLFAGSLATADQTVKTFPPGSASDVLDKAEMDPKNPVGPAGGAIEVRKDCKTASGKVVKRGETGYESCLNEKLERAGKPSETPTKKQ
jgi:hypothetical protein